MNDLSLLTDLRTSKKEFNNCFNEKETHIKEVLTNFLDNELDYKKTGYVINIDKEMIDIRLYVATEDYPLPFIDIFLLNKSLQDLSMEGFSIYVKDGLLHLNWEL